MYIYIQNKKMLDYRIRRNNYGPMHSPLYPSMQGSGMFDFLKKMKKKHLKKLRSRPKSIDDFIKKNETLKITKIKVCRRPLPKYIQKALNLVQKNDVEALKKKYNYDELFHLYMILYFEDGQIKLIEKNEIAQIIDVPKEKLNTECKERILSPKKTLKEVIEKSEAVYPNLYYYSAQKENCQKFVNTLLKQMNINLEDFVMQYHVDEIMTKGTKKLSHFLTTLSASFKRYVLGKGDES